MVENPGVIHSVCFMFCSGDYVEWFFLDRSQDSDDSAWGERGGLSWFVDKQASTSEWFANKKLDLQLIYIISTKTASVSKTKKMGSKF